MTFDVFLSKLHNVERVDENIYSASCPSCGSPGFKCYEYDGIVVFCDEGCTPAAICDALHITETDLMSDRRIFINSPMYGAFKSLDEVTEQEARWLIDGWIPEEQITLLAGDGGTGKTTLWCNIVAALSSGKPCILDKPDVKREPQTVLFMTTEDSVSRTLKRKLNNAGAVDTNIISMDMAEDRSGALRDLKFGTDEMAQVIRYYEPKLCAFDPVQGFVPPEINMGSRNAMRDCMAPLISLGEECGTSFLVVCHTNKRRGVAGRYRISDSSDLWDISRSVLIAGHTGEDDIKYLSQEKSNYGRLQKTVLFEVNDSGILVPKGTTWKRDADFVTEQASSKTAPKREDCKEFILNTLDNACGEIKAKDLEEKALLAGFTNDTLRRAKAELKEAGEIVNVQGGAGRNKTKVWYIKRPGFIPVYEESTPFD